MAPFWTWIWDYTSIRKNHALTTYRTIDFAILNSMDPLDLGTSGYYGMGMGDDFAGMLLSMRHPDYTDFGEIKLDEDGQLSIISSTNAGDQFTALSSAPDATSLTWRDNVGAIGGARADNTGMRIRYSSTGFFTPESEVAADVNRAHLFYELPTGRILLEAGNSSHATTPASIFNIRTDSLGTHTHYLRLLPESDTILSNSSWEFYEQYVLPKNPSTALGDTSILFVAGDGAGGTTSGFIDHQNPSRRRVISKYPTNRYDQYRKYGTG